MKEFLKTLNLDDEISNKILNKYNDDIGKLNQGLETANKSLDLKNKELEDINKNIKELQKLEPEKIKEELENTKIKIKELQENHKIELDNLKIDNAINTSLFKSGAINNKAVVPFINRELVRFDDKGDIVGLDEQLKELMENKDTSFLFKKEDSGGIKGLNIKDIDNATPGNSIGKPINNNLLNQKTFELGNIPSFESYAQQFNNSQ